MPSILARLLALIVCCLSAALIVAAAFGDDEPAHAEAVYASNAEVRLATLLEPVFVPDAFRLALSDPTNPQLSVLVDAQIYPRGDLPLDKAALKALVAGVLSVPSDSLRLDIRHVNFDRNGGGAGFHQHIEFMLAITLGITSLALLWTLTRLDHRSIPAPISGTHSETPTSEPLPTPQVQAAKLIKGWMQEAEQT